jgi:PAS domain S-box-containing protein
MNKDIAASDLVLNADTLIKIIDKLPHVVYLKDSQHRFLLANKACLAMLNTNGDKLIGQTDHNFHTPGYVKYVHDMENSILRNGEKKVVPEERFIDPTGKEQIMKTTRLPFYIPEMNEIGILGIAVNMAKEKEMEESIRFQNEVLQQQKEEIDGKRKIAEELYNKVKNGLKVSKFIQEAILPNEASVRRILPDSFVMYKPKKYTNGDFYWVKEKDGLVYIATIDCTEFDAGGTFIAMLCYDLLTQIVKENQRPSPTEILYEINDGLKSNLEQAAGVSEMKEHVYINICIFDKEKYYIEHSGSGAPMLLINKYSNFLMESKNSKRGLPFDDTEMRFLDNRMRVTKGDVIYLMTNGFSLQKTKVRADKEILGYNKLRNLILEISDASMDKQLEMLNEFLVDFMGDEEQTDDIVLIGVRV